MLACSTLVLALVPWAILPSGFAEPAAPIAESPPVPELNTQYFRGMLQKPWTMPEWGHRVPTLVAESGGAEQYKAPITIVHEFPPGIAASSIRVVTPWGDEIPCQARRLEEEGNRIQVFFLTSLMAHEYKPLFLYCDDEEKSAAALPAESDLGLSQEGDFYVLRNVSMKVKLRKDSPVIVYLAPRENRTGNQLFTQNDLLPWSTGCTLGRYVEFGGGRVLEDGPLRKAIMYEGSQRGRTYRIVLSLTSGARRLGYRTEGMGRMLTQASWLPGTGMKPENPDYLVFAGAEGLEKEAIATTGWLGKDVGPTDGENFSQRMSEGWYAYENPATSQAVGELFDLSSFQNLEIYIHGNAGYCTGTSGQGGKQGTIRRALVPASQGGYRRVREEYLAFKHPPLTACSEIQKRADVPTTHPKPVFGKNMLLSHHQTYRHYKGKNLFPEAPEKCLPFLIRALKRDGANWISMWAYGPFWESAHPSAKGPHREFMGHLLKAARAAGMGVETYAHRHGASVARELGHYDLDIYLLKDECNYQMQSEKDFAEFKQKYGMDAPAKLEVARLHEPAHHNRVFFQMGKYTELIRGMANAVRENNQKVLLGDQVNATSMLSVTCGGPHDWERHTDFLDTLSMDLYGKPAVTWKYFAKYMRAVLNNQKPILFYWGCDDRRETVWPNALGLIMWSADGLFHFPAGYVNVDVCGEIEKLYYYLQYTGLGDRVATYEPVRSVAFFLDRAGLLDSIKKGQWSNLGSLYQRRVWDYVSLKNVQSDIVASKYFALPNLAGYSLVVVPSDPVLSDEHAQVLQKFVEAGGSALIEGECLNNSVIQKLVKVSPTGKLGPLQGEVKGTPSFSFSGGGLPVRNDGAEVAAQMKSGEPVLLTARFGKGQVAYTPLVLSEKISFQSDVTVFLRGWIDKLSAPPPIRVVDLTDSIDSNVSSDGENYLVALHNYAAWERSAEVTVHLAELPETVMDFATGKKRPCEKQMALAVPARATRFFYVGSEQGIALPAATPGAPGDMPDFCAEPGTGVTDLVVSVMEADGDTKLRKRKKAEGVSYIGIVSDKGCEDRNTKSRVVGDEGILQSLQDRRELKADLIQGLSPAALEFYDAIVIPHIGHARVPSVLKEGWQTLLREYAEQGGGVLLSHHAAGYPNLCAAAFPEVGEPTGDYVAQIQEILVEKEHPVTNASSIKKRFPRLYGDPAFKDQFEVTVMPTGQGFGFGFPDYLPLKPGTMGEVIARGAKKEGIGGEPVVVVGTFGKGRIVLCGTAIGSTYARKEKLEKTSKLEESLLLNAVYWLCEKE